MIQKFRISARQHSFSFSFANSSEGHVAVSATKKIVKGAISAIILLKVRRALKLWRQH